MGPRAGNGIAALIAAKWVGVKVMLPARGAGRAGRGNGATSGAASEQKGIAAVGPYMPA